MFYKDNYKKSNFYSDLFGSKDSTELRRHFSNRESAPPYVNTTKSFFVSNFNFQFLQNGLKTAVLYSHGKVSIFCVDFLQIK